MFVNKGKQRFSLVFNMKFYIHCKDPDMTMVLKWDNLEGTVQDLCQIVNTSMVKKFPQLKGNDMEFKVRGKVLQSDDVVIKKIKNKDDVDVIVQNSSQTKLQTAKPETSTPAVNGTKKLESSTPAVNDSKKLESELLSTATTLVERQHYRKAISLYDELIKNNPQNCSAYFGIVDCYLKSRRAKRALHYLKKLQQLKFKDTEKDIQFRLGKCYVLIGDGDKAIEILQKHCVELRKSGGTDTKHKHQVQVLLAKAYLLKDQKDLAIVILQGILREDQTIVDALTEYAPLIYHLGPAQSEEAMTVLLTLVANHRESSYIREKFALTCQQPHGLKVLESVAGKVWSDVASLVFMATTIREYGAIEEAISLMRHACDLNRSDPHTLLTYVHMLEVVNDRNGAIKDILQFINSHQDLKIDSFTCEDLYPLTKYMASEEFDFDTQKDLGNELLIRNPTNAIYSPDEMYLLALLHTFVKILYVSGWLWVLPHLKNVLDPLSENRDLHLTNIRNEAAYFTCISKVLETKRDFPPNLRKDRKLYFVGDSHCITPAYENILFRGQSHLIQPILSTGTKIWHLRSESKFYPKLNFYNVIKSIPKMSPVILCFGEIDCREALLLCVEKAKYDSLEEAIETVVKIYINVIQDLIRKHQWEIYVHPVMPVLDLTRSLVMQFNTLLEIRIKKEKEIQWLDFVYELLCTNAEGDLVLKEEYKFDGTHVHPSYTHLLETALEKTNHNVNNTHDNSS